MNDITSVPTVSEEDMSRVKHVFDNALNAIVGMSQLSKDVDILRTQVNDLTSTVNRYRNQLDYQEDMLSQARDKRRALEQEKDELHAKATQLQTQVDVFNSANSSLNERVSQLTETINRLTTERDDAQYKALELTDKLAASEEAHQKFRSRAKELASLFDPAPSTETPTISWPITPAATQEPVPYEPAHEHTDTSMDHGSHVPVPTEDGYRDPLTGQWVKGSKQLAREEAERKAHQDTIEDNRPWWEKDKDAVSN